MFFLNLFGKRIYLVNVVKASIPESYVIIVFWGFKQKRSTPVLSRSSNPTLIPEGKNFPITAADLLSLVGHLVDSLSLPVHSALPI